MLLPTALLKNRSAQNQMTCLQLDYALLMFALKHVSLHSRGKA
jgi:hypothetical protein